MNSDKVIECTCDVNDEGHCAFCNDWSLPYLTDSLNKFVSDNKLYRNGENVLKANSGSLHEHVANIQCNEMKMTVGPLVYDGAPY